jgi:hypothetical protein
MTLRVQRHASNVLDVTPSVFPVHWPTNRGGFGTELVVDAEAAKDIAAGRARLTTLEASAASAGADAKARMGLQIAALQLDVASAEAKLAEMKKASASRWREFEADLSAATARLRLSVDKAVG